MRFDFVHLSTFDKQTFVVCPTCGAKAVVSAVYEEQYEARFVCPSCATNKVWAGNARSFVSAHPAMEQQDGIISGPAVDRFFKYSLWYQADFKNETLYAYNLAHLDFLKAYVAAPLRERRQAAFGWSNQSLQSRLPKWLLSGKNRSGILKKLAELTQR